MMLGLRIDGRRANELRHVTCQLNVLYKADGSAQLEMGNTKVLCAVYGPREARYYSKMFPDRTLLNCEYSMALFSTYERRKRSKGDRKSHEMSILIQQALENVVLTTLYPRSQIDIYIQVLQADGGRL
jgi:exosome complex component RRP41